MENQSVILNNAQRRIKEAFSIFNEEQIEAIKLILREGGWGDTDMEFGNKIHPNYAYGYYTNMKKGKQFSGLMSGISKKIKSSETEAVKMCSDWWGDGNGDVMFFNLDFLDETELDNWAENKF